MMSALNALPWDDDEEGENSSSASDEEGDAVPPPSQSRQAAESVRVSHPNGRLSSSAEIALNRIYDGAVDP